MIKKMMAIGSAMFLLSLLALAQQIIENSGKPLSKNAGRVIGLKEVLKITDESGAFYFKYPRISAIGPDGSIFVQDNEQILHFDKDGKFVRNYFKKGQGPGEMTNAFALIPNAQGLCIEAYAPGKLVWFDGQGMLVKERPVRPAGRSLIILQAIFSDMYIFSSSEFPAVTGEPQVLDNPCTIFCMKDGTEELKKLQSFPVKAWVVTSGGGGGMSSMAPFFAVPLKSGFLVIVHTSEYLIKILDVAANEVIRVFNRKYDRVETPPAKPQEKAGTVMVNSMTPPRQKYLNDISRIFVKSDAIWAVTSTRDPKKGVMIDVFNAAGAYTDSFYLNVPAGVQFFIFGDFCYTAEKNADETYAIKKYKIEWKD
ncbi:MAG: hypothetical protein ABSF88_07815 [Candidatus Aminicenantales bacterium]